MERRRRSIGKRFVAAQLDALDLRRREATGSYAVGTLPLAALEQAVAAIEEEAEAVRRRLATMASWSPMRLYAREPGLLRDCWDEVGLDARRALLAAVIDKAVISRARPASPARFDPGRVDIRWRV